MRCHCRPSSRTFPYPLPSSHIQVSQSDCQTVIPVSFCLGNFCRHIFLVKTCHVTFEQLWAVPLFWTICGITCYATMWPWFTCLLMCLKRNIVKDRLYKRPSTSISWQSHSSNLKIICFWNISLRRPQLIPHIMTSPSLSIVLVNLAIFLQITRYFSAFSSK